MGVLEYDHGNFIRVKSSLTKRWEDWISALAKDFIYPGTEVYLYRRIWQFHQDSEQLHLGSWGCAGVKSILPFFCGVYVTQPRVPAPEYSPFLVSMTEKFEWILLVRVSVVFASCAAVCCFGSVPNAASLSTYRYCYVGQPLSSVENCFGNVTFSKGSMHETQHLQFDYPVWLLLQSGHTGTLTEAHNVHSWKFTQLWSEQNNPILMVVSNTFYVLLKTVFVV